MEIEETTITPALAAKLLEGNTRNRLLSPRRVNALVQCLQRGQWRTDGSPYRLTDDGLLLDGQHRLQAIIQAGIEVPGIIIRGVPADAQMVIDTGRPRSFADWLRMMGEPNVSNAGAATRLLYNYRSGALADGTWRDYFVSTPEMWEFYQQNMDAIKEGVAAAQKVRSFCQINGSVAAVLYVITNEIDPGDQAEFFAQIAKRSIPVPPVLQLIRHMDNRERKLPAGSMEQRVQLMLCIKTWNRFRAGDHSNLLLSVRRTDKFPEPK